MNDKMSSENICPLCGYIPTCLIEELQVTDIVFLYQKSLGIDCSSDFIGIQKVGYFHCMQCDLRFFFPPVTGSEEFYTNLEKRNWYYLEEKNEFAFAQQFIKKTDTILDIGCGRGSFQKLIPYSEYVGLELNRSAIKAGQKDGKVILKQTIVEHAVDHANKYNVVCAFQVLEHVENVSEFIVAAVTCLKPNGMLMFSVPSYDSFSQYILNHTLDLPPHHQSRWSDLALDSVAKLYKLDVVELWHEDLQFIHKDFYARTIFFNSICKFLGRRQLSIDLRFSTKALQIISSILAKIFVNGLSSNVLFPRGMSVTAIYRLSE